LRLGKAVFIVHCTTHLPLSLKQMQIFITSERAICYTYNWHSL